jgi:hypothetical protein
MTLDLGPSQLAQTPPPGDGLVFLLLIVFGLFILFRLLELGTASVKKLPPGKKAPWTGRYEAPERKWSQKGDPLPPTSSSGAKWNLKEPYSSSGWLIFALVLAAVGVVCYGSGVGVTNLQELVSSSPTPAPVTSGSPVPPPQQTHRVIKHAQHGRVHGHHSSHHAHPLRVPVGIA